MDSYPFPESDPKIHCYQADVYSFRWPDYSSWAIFTVCDATGEFGIQSDWGTHSYRWNAPALGPYASLTEFLPSCNPEYIMRKFRYVKQDDTADQFDEEATKAYWGEKIKEDQEKGWVWGSNLCSAGMDVSDKQAEEAEVLLRAEMKDFFDLVDDYSLDLAIHDIASGLYEFLGQEPYEHLRYKESTTVMICRDELLPRFLQYLKEHVVPSRAVS